MISLESIMLNLKKQLAGSNNTMYVPSLLLSSSTSNIASRKNIAPVVCTSSMARKQTRRKKTIHQKGPGIKKRTSRWGEKLLMLKRKSFSTGLLSSVIDSHQGATSESPLSMNSQAFIILNILGCSMDVLTFNSLHLISLF